MTRNRVPESLNLQQEAQARQFCQLENLELSFAGGQLRNLGNDHVVVQHRESQ